jgi:hypothetical protein
MTIPAPTRVGRLQVESRHLPATQGGGGDIHDVMATPFGVRLLIGDVMGTGLPANRTGLAVLNAWRELACTEPSLAGVAVRLHAMIARSEHPERFVTALLAGFGDLAAPGEGGRIAGSWAEVVCCGHPPPLLLRHGAAAFIEPSAAPPLGLLDLADGWCRATMIPVSAGDRLLLYTDGVSEARDAHGRFFPLDQAISAALQSPEASSPNLLDTLVTSLDAHVGDRGSDDILLLLVTLRLPAGYLVACVYPDLRRGRHDPRVNQAPARRAARRSHQVRRASTRAGRIVRAVAQRPAGHCHRSRRGRQDQDRAACRGAARRGVRRRRLPGRTVRTA